jgi:hypothetical protein
MNGNRMRVLREDFNFIDCTVQGTIIGIYWHTKNGQGNNGTGEMI